MPDPSELHADVVTGMMAFTAAGYPVFPLTQNKRPGVQWGPLRETPPDLLQIQAWGAQHYEGYAVICGGSQRLLVIDFEGRFMESHFNDFVTALHETRSYDLFATWLRGYCVTTPGGGMHVAIHLGGSMDGEVTMPGNTKLASDDTSVLVETRAEGGYVVGPGSGGRTHPNGGRWTQTHGGPDTVEWATYEEWRGISHLLEGFDSTPPAPTPEPTRPPILRLNEDRALPDGLPLMETVLSSLGFDHVRNEPLGSLWRHPNSTNEQSVRVNAAGRLYVFSSSLPMRASSELGDRTYDVIEVIAAYRFGRTPTPEDCGEILREYRQRAQRPTAERGAGATAESAAELNLPSSFWEAREYLSHIRQAALARRLSPDAVWEGVKCFYAATIPWNHRLPDDGTMDYISLVVGRSGAGKSRAKQEAYNLLEGAHGLGGVVFPVPPGSGEGMAEFFLDRTESDNKYRYRGVGYYSDEGKWLLDTNQRAGNTTIQALKQLWSGELTGSVAATAERHRWLAPRDVRASVLIAATPEVAVQFLRNDLTDEGLPQRISWGWAHYPHPDVRPEHPGPLEVQIWDHKRASSICEIDLAADIAQMIDERQLAASRGEQEGGLEGHSTYATLKTAGILAHLDGRMSINNQDWALGAQDWNQSRKVRDQVLAFQDRGLHDRDQAAGMANARRKMAEEQVYLERAALSLARRVHSDKAPLHLRAAKDYLRTYWKRHRVHHTDVLELVASRKWVVMGEDGNLAPGLVNPGGSGGS